MIVDLFAGPGGWDEGLRMIGRTDVVGLEWDAAACATAKAAGHARIRTDVATYPTEAFGAVEGLIASPPCQDFSPAGNRAGIEGDKGKLVAEVMRWATALRPQWIACEQVPEVFPTWQHYAHQLRSLGYSTWAGLVNAADYGVPQERERALLLAALTGHVEPPMPTHAPMAEPDTMFGPGRSAWRTLRDATGRSGEWELHHIRGAGMTERHGKRPGRHVDRPGFTVLAWKDSRMRWEHPDGRRERFTLSDALAVQTFAPDYPVQGSSTKAHEQIGNAVPPLLAAHVLAALGVGPLPAEVAA